MPFAQLVEPHGLEPEHVREAVDDARVLVRDHGRSLLIWLVGPDYEWLGPQLEQLGLAHDDTPGFEAVENAMALVEPPKGDPPADVVVQSVDSYEAFAASQRLAAEVFEMTEEMREEMEAGLAERYDEYTTPGNPLVDLKWVL